MRSAHFSRLGEVPTFPYLPYASGRRRIIVIGHLLRAIVSGQRQDDDYLVCDMAQRTVPDGSKELRQAVSCNEGTKFVKNEERKLRSASSGQRLELCEGVREGVLAARKCFEGPTATRAIRPSPPNSKAPQIQFDAWGAVE